MNKIKICIQQKPTLLPFCLVVLAVTIWLLFGFRGSFIQLWFSNDQRGAYHYKKQDFSTASKLFEDPLHKASSFYRAGEFKKAKAIYSTMSSPEAKYNLGNSLLMLGKYDEAIKAYTVALQMQPNFKEAKENKTLAEVRKKLKDVENDGKQGIGDMYDMQPDEIVYDNDEKKGVDDTKREDKKKHSSDSAHWLDRIQTSPKDFLKHKFSYQYGMGDTDKK